MTLFVVFFTVVFLLIGYFLMDRLDKFIQNNIVSSDELLKIERSKIRETKQKIILLFGENELTAMVKAYFDAYKVIYQIVTDVNTISSYYEYNYLFALSHSDSDNLMISSVGLKVYCIPHIIALCNSQNNMKIYNEFNFEKVLSYDDDTEKLFNSIKGFIQNAAQCEVKIHIY